jgi:hypothetical protein
VPCQSGVKAKSGMVVWDGLDVDQEQADSGPRRVHVSTLKKIPRRVHGRAGRASQAVQPSKRFEKGTISDHQMKVLTVRGSPENKLGHHLPESNASRASPPFSVAWDR